MLIVTAKSLLHLVVKAKWTQTTSQTLRARIGLVVCATSEEQKPADVARANMRCGISDKESPASQAESTKFAAPFGHAPSSTTFDGEAVFGRCLELIPS